MDMLFDGLSWVCLVSGGVFVLIGGVGLLRLPDVYARMHAAGVTDTLGAGLMLVGLAFQSGLSHATVKLVLIFVFLVFTSPTATHAVARAASHSGLAPLLGSSGEKREKQPS